MSEEKNVPNIRFKGFTDPWEQRKLSDLTERVTRKNKNNESERPLTISAQDGLIDQNNFFDKQIASRDVSGYFLVKNGEFAYNKSYSNGYPWGAVKRLDRYDMGVLSTLYIIFRPTNVSSQFLVSYYDTTSWHREVAKNAAEGARNHGLLNITPADFFNTVLLIPNSISEQKKIGAFFKQLDDTIALHQQKVTQLKELKKLLMQKIFDQEWRFKGFTDPWEQRKLGDIFKERKERSAEGELISITLEKGIVKATSLSRKDNSSKDKHNYKVIKKGDVAYNSMRMWQGASGYSQYNGILSPAYTVITPCANNNAIFFSYMFKRREMIQTFQKNSQGLTSDTWNLKFPALSLIKVRVPKVREQAIISDTLKCLDATIALHQQKVDQLKELKKYLMQNLFV